MSSARASGGKQTCEGGAQRMKIPRILVVDDIQDNLDLIVELFEGEPWNVRTADNSKDAWAVVKRWHPDLVLLDIQMPGYNGHHLCTAIHMEPEMDDILVVFLTAERTSEAEVERGLKMGAVDYICKPVDGAVLRERVRAVVEHWRERAAGAGE